MNDAQISYSRPKVLRIGEFDDHATRSIGYRHASLPASPCLGLRGRVLQYAIPTSRLHPLYSGSAVGIRIFLRCHRQPFLLTRKLSFDRSIPDVMVAQQYNIIYSCIRNSLIRVFEVRRNYRGPNVF